MKQLLTIELKEKLDCGKCSDVILTVYDPLKLIYNTPATLPDAIRYRIAGKISDVTLLCGHRWLYVIEYDDAVLQDPGRLLTACDIREVCCAGCFYNFFKELYPQGLWWPGDSFYGSGNDGSRVIVGPSENLSFPVRMYYYENITIDESGTFFPYSYLANDGSGDPNDRALFPIFVTDTLVVNGHLSCDGNNGVGQAPGNKIAIPNSVGGGNDAGGSGGNGADPNFGIPAGNGQTPARSRSPFFGGGFMGGSLGGSGGNGGGASPGNGYTPVIGLDALYWALDRLIFVDTPAFIGFVLSTGGGCGAGGGGGGDATGTSRGGDGGGGGASGGSVYIMARHIIVGPNGKISANGGRGGAGQTGLLGGAGDAAGGGGGGGGGGGLLYLVYDTLINNGVIEATGGEGGPAGAGVGGAPDGVPGVDGIDGKIYLMNLQTGLFQP